jgi:hypothetical protein
MATIIQRKAKNGELSYVVRVRRKGSVSQTATFHSLKDAKKYAQITEGAILEGRHFPTQDSKRQRKVALHSTVGKLTCNENGGQTYSSWYASTHRQEDYHGPHNNILPQ